MTLCRATKYSWWTTNHHVGQGGWLSYVQKVSRGENLRMLCVLFRLKFRILFKDAKLLRSSWRKWWKCWRLKTPTRLFWIFWKTTSLSCETPYSLERSKLRTSSNHPSGSPPLRTQSSLLSSAQQRAGGEFGWEPRRLGCWWQSGRKQWQLWWARRVRGLPRRPW